MALVKFKVIFSLQISLYTKTNGKWITQFLNLDFKEKVKKKFGGEIFILFWGSGTISQNSYKP